MEMRHLLALITVARTTSFTGAAEQLSLTQSAVTRQIALLERETRCRLFDRLGRKVVLTAAGDVIYKYAQEILRLDSEALHAVAEVSSGASGKLAVGSSSTAAAYLLPHLLGNFRRRHPAIEISVLTGPSKHVADLVTNNQVDIGLVMDDPKQGGLTSVKIAKYTVALIVYSGHPIIDSARGRIDGVTLQELSELRLILMQKGASLRNSADSLLGQMSSQLYIAMELDNVEAIKKMIEAQMGVSLLPMMSVINEVAAGTLIALPIDSPDAPQPSIAIVHRSDKYVTVAMSSFIDLTIEHLGQDG